VSAALTLRVVNQAESPVLSSATLKLKGLGDISFGNVEPGGKSSDEKAGPVDCETPDVSKDVRGVLVVSDTSVPIKITLPASLFLVPWTGLAQDDVMNELSSSTQWFSHSSKVDVSSMKDPAKAKTSIASFLQAAEVEGGDSMVGTLAAQSNRGSRVLALVKVKGKVCKVDIKCTDESLGKALASDLKKLSM
jgi:hypothetical protein